MDKLQLQLANADTELFNGNQCLIFREPVTISYIKQSDL
jgi:hypothetical protein